MDALDQEYRDCVVAWFDQHKFCECSFKGKDHWYEVLDPEWNWDKFDYRIPDYEEPKSQAEVISNTDDFMKGFTNFS